MENIELKTKINEMKVKLAEKIAASLENADKISSEEALAYAQAGDILSHNIESYSDMLTKTMDMMKAQQKKPEDKPTEPEKKGDSWDNGFFGC